MKLLNLLCSKNTTDCDDIVLLSSCRRHHVNLLQCYVHSAVCRSVGQGLRSTQKSNRISSTFQLIDFRSRKLATVQQTEQLFDELRRGICERPAMELWKKNKAINPTKELLHRSPVNCFTVQTDKRTQPTARWCFRKLLFILLIRKEKRKKGSIEV